MENLDPEIELYKGKGSTILETIVSGAVGGTIWGTVTGILAVLGIFQLAGLSQNVVNPGSLQWTAVMSMLGLMAGGAFVGSMIGLFIGCWASPDWKTDTSTPTALKNGQILDARDRSSERLSDSLADHASDCPGVKKFTGLMRIRLSVI